MAVAEKFRSDFKFGREQEKNYLPLFREKFCDKLKPTKRNFVFDFESENCYVELKSRKSEIGLYPTAMLGKNKLDFAETCDKPVYFCFSFTDGIYYWKFDKEEIGKNIAIRKGGRCDRGKPEWKDYAFINTSILSAF